MNKSFDDPKEFMDASNSIEAGITKLIGKAKMAKRSAVIERVVTNLFPKVKDSSDQYAYDVYDMINSKILAMIIVGKLSQFEFQNFQGVVLDAMLVDPSLNLVTQFDEIGQDNGEDESEESDEADDESVFGPNDEQFKNRGEDQDDVQELAEDLLAERSEGLLLITLSETDGESVTETRVLETAEQALGEYLEASKRPFTSAHLYSMIPIDVQVSLSFKEQFSSVNTQETKFADTPLLD